MCQFYFESLINEKNQEYGKICLGNVENITYGKYLGCGFPFYKLIIKIKGIDFESLPS